MFNEKSIFKLTIVLSQDIFLNVICYHFSVTLKKPKDILISVKTQK